jgi:hypothetical protein
MRIQAQAETFVYRLAAVPAPEFPQSSHDIPDVGEHPDPFWGGGGCAHMALAFKNMFPQMKIGVDVDDKDGTVNHAWAHDGKRAFDYMGTHPDPHGPSGAFSNYTHHEDMHPQQLADMFGQDGISWSPDDPWADNTTTDAAEEIEKHFMGRHYNPDTGEYEATPPSSPRQRQYDDDDWDD